MAKRTAAAIAAKGGRAGYLRHDVRDEAAWKAAVGEAERRFGGLDILLNNAGIFALKPMSETSRLKTMPTYKGNKGNLLQHWVLTELTLLLKLQCQPSATLCLLDAHSMSPYATGEIRSLGRQPAHSTRSEAACLNTEVDTNEPGPNYWFRAAVALWSIQQLQCLSAICGLAP